MGGYTFGVVARRLSSEQLHALFKWAEPRIQPFTQFQIANPQTASDKVTHGDLDILMGSWCTGEGFKYNFAVESPEAAKDTQPLDADHWRRIGADEEYQWTPDDVRAWAASIGLALGANAWQNHQHGVSLAIPVTVLGDQVANAKEDEFFQVDLRMIRPDRFEFGVFIMSYGITALFMAQAVMSLSRAIIIHNEHCVIRHTAYPGLPVVRVELTKSAPELLDWLGLDYTRWQGGFETQRDFWRWISGVDSSNEAPNLTLVQRAWTAFAATTGTVEKVHTRHQHPRFAEVERFRDWLRPVNSTPAKRSEVIAADAHEKQPSSHGPSAPPSRYDIVTRVSVSIDTQTGIMTKEAEETSIQPIAARPSVRRPVETHAISSSSPQPLPLDRFAIQALSHFGKLQEYETAVARQSVDATILYEKQRRKAQNRQYAQDHEAKTAKIRAQDSKQ